MTNLRICCMSFRRAIDPDIKTSGDEFPVINEVNGTAFLGCGLPYSRYTAIFFCPWCGTEVIHSGRNEVRLPHYDPVPGERLVDSVRNYMEEIEEYVKSLAKGIKEN